MAPPLQLFVGWDSREPIGFQVFCHSVLRRASRPIMIVPLVQSQLRAAGLYTRERGPTEATEFSMTRFLVPHLCNYKGHAIFLDGADMLCLANIYELQALIEDSIWNRGYGPHRINPHERVMNRRKAVLVAQHDYVPKASLKMDGQPQTAYPRKNWSSLICFDNEQCRHLTPAYVNSTSGLDLHRFNWLEDEQIGALPLEWGWLVGEYAPNAQAKILHYTLGTPAFEAYRTCDHADLWWKEFNNMLQPAHVKVG